MEKFTNYEEVAERLKIFLKRQRIIDEPDFPSLLKIKLAIENNFEGFRQVNLLIDNLNEKLRKESKFKFFGDEINIQDFDVELNDKTNKITFYYKPSFDNVRHSITFEKPKFKNDEYEISKFTDFSMYYSKFVYQFFNKYKDIINQIFSNLDPYLFVGQASILSEIPYDILKVSFVLDPYDANNIVKVFVKPNEECVEINHETMRAFKEIIPGNEEKIIYSLVYDIAKLKSELAEIYSNNNQKVDVLSYRRKLNDYNTK